MVSPIDSHPRMLSDFQFKFSEMIARGNKDFHLNRICFYALQYSTQPLIPDWAQEYYFQLSYGIYNTIIPDIISLHIQDNLHVEGGFTIFHFQPFDHSSVITLIILYLSDIGLYRILLPPVHLQSLLTQYRVANVTRNVTNLSADLSM